MNICRECKHVQPKYITEWSSLPVEFYCCELHVKASAYRSPVTGWVAPVRYDLCMDHNLDGNCPDWEPQPPKAAPAPPAPRKPWWCFWR